MSAVSLYSIGFNFARIVGPSIGGVLILWIGVGGCLVVYAVSLLISAVELLGIRLATRPSGRTGQNVLQEFFAGLRYVAATPMILASTVAAYVISVKERVSVWTAQTFHYLYGLSEMRRVRGSQHKGVNERLAEHELDGRPGL